MEHGGDLPAKAPPLYEAEQAKSTAVDLCGTGIFPFADEE